MFYGLLAVNYTPPNSRKEDKRFLITPLERHKTKVRPPHLKDVDTTEEQQTELPQVVDMSADDEGSDGKRASKKEITDV